MKKEKSNFYKETRCKICYSGCNCGTCRGQNIDESICYRCYINIADKIPNHIPIKQHDKYVIKLILKKKKRRLNEI